MANSLPIIDADAPTSSRTERTWDYLDAAERKYRPKAVSTQDYRHRQYWVIYDKIAGFRFLTLTSASS